jgi:hypothetical protein
MGAQKKLLDPVLDRMYRLGQVADAADQHDPKFDDFFLTDGELWAIAYAIAPDIFLDGNLAALRAGAGADHGFVCKKCGKPSPTGVGYVDNSPGAAELSAGLTACGCGYSVRFDALLLEQIRTAYHDGRNGD